MLNILKKIYPPPMDNNYEKMDYDEEGLWSITHPNEANNISTNLLKYVNKDNKIIDLTAGWVNLISFGKYFNNVTGLSR